MVAFIYVISVIRVIESETLQITTYYPAPYGAYASILTTQDTWLARDGGRVGIGTDTPSEKLDVQNGNVGIGGDLIFNRSNKWIFHTPDDRRTSLFNLLGRATGGIGIVVLK